MSLGTTNTHCGPGRVDSRPKQECHRAPRPPRRRPPDHGKVWNDAGGPTSRHRARVVTWTAEQGRGPGQSGVMMEDREGGPRIPETEVRRPGSKRSVRDPSTGP